MNYDFSLSFELKSIDSGFKLSGSFRSGDQLSFTVWKGEEMRNWDIKTPPFDHSTFELTLDGVDNGIEVIYRELQLQKNQI